MKKLTNNEINFIKETRFTATTFQCDEYNKTIFKDFEEAKTVAKKKYHIDINKLLNKIDNEDETDGISLEENAEYLLKTFFTQEELETKPAKELLSWLQNFRYFFGYRKWTETDVDYLRFGILENN